MQVLRSTTLVLVRGFVEGSTIKVLESTPRSVAALPEQVNGDAPPRVHQQTVSEAKEVWRYEGNPN